MTAKKNDTTDQAVLGTGAAGDPAKPAEARPVGATTFDATVTPAVTTETVVQKKDEDAK